MSNTARNRESLPGYNRYYRSRGFDGNDIICDISDKTISIYDQQKVAADKCDLLPSCKGFLITDEADNKRKTCYKSELVPLVTDANKYNGIMNLKDGVVLPQSPEQKARLDEFDKSADIVAIVIGSVFGLIFLVIIIAIIVSIVREKLAERKKAKEPEITQAP